VALKFKSRARLPAADNVNTVPGRIVVFLVTLTCACPSTTPNSLMPNTAAIDFYRMRSLGIEMWKLKIHRRLIRTGLGTCFADSVGVAAMTTVTDGIGVGPVISGADEQRVIAVNIDGIRSRPAPGEVHSVSSLHLAANCSETDCSGSGSRC
jgi:hypothetical protein